MCTVFATYAHIMHTKNSLTSFVYLNFLILYKMQNSLNKNRCVLCIQLLKVIKLLIANVNVLVSA